MDSLVESGNRSFENLDNVDFASFRSNEKLQKSEAKKARKAVAKFHNDTKSEAFEKDVQRVVDARFLQGHGIQVQGHLDGQEMAQLRKYVSSEESNGNIADSSRAINTSLQSGEQNVQSLIGQSEGYLFEERGVSAQTFQEKFSGLGTRDLKKVRDFSDAWSTSQGAKFLNGADGETFNDIRDDLSRDMLADHGYTNLHNLDLDTVMSLLRDIDAEGPRSNATIRDAVNAAVGSGESDYFNLNTKANEAVLESIGVPKSQIKAMSVKSDELAAAYPDLEPNEARATRTRVLRDLLRVLPEGERGLALAELKSERADLINAEEVLDEFFGERIRAFAGNSVKFADMGAMQRANFTSAVSRLPQGVRSRVFNGTPKETVKKFVNLIEHKFGLEVHNKAGRAPEGNESYAPFVKKWTPQGLSDLYNALNTMAKGGKLPGDLAKHSTIAYLEGAPGNESSSSSASNDVEPDPVGPYGRPGAWAHASGKSGYFGQCGQVGKGHDVVFIFDDALYGTNADSAEGLTIGESTILHEFGHAVQLGGTPGADDETRLSEEQNKMAEWSMMSEWKEPGDVIADGRMGSFAYYYDPTVQVGKRSEVATSYGASDPCEDYAEYTPFFYKDAETAMGLSPEKFLYLNQELGGYYSPDEVSKVGAKLGLNQAAIADAKETMEIKVLYAAEEAGLAS